MKELQQILDVFMRLNQDAALATIVRAHGSSYRRPGARLLALADGGWIGTLSGGCIEEEVAAQARRVIEHGVAEVVCVDTLRRYGCPGSLEILLERVRPGNAFLSYVRQCFSQRRAAEIVAVGPSPRAGVTPGSHPRSDFPDASGFSQTLLPPVRLIILGTGSDTQALLDFSGVLGWETVVLEQVEELGSYADERSAVIVKNHHFGRDAAALSHAFAGTFGYVGLLSSRKRKQRLLEMLESEYLEGPDAAPPASFYSPAGVDLGAESPEEVALSIVAEIQAVMAAHEAGFLRDRRTPIHKNSCLAGS